MTSIYRWVIGLILILVASLTISAQNGYKIKISIDGYIDSTLLLTSYFGDKIKLVDTAYSNKPGEFTFIGSKTLPGGIYMAVSPQKKKLFEFIISSEQDFTLSTDTSNYAMNMKVKGSKDNKVFYNYLRYNEKKYQQSIKLKAEIDSLDNLSVNTLSLVANRDSLNNETIQYKLDLIEKYNGSFVAALLNSMRDIEIPDSISSSSDSTLAFKYYKRHFWDNMDLSDSSLLRTPVYMRKFKQYFEQVVVFNPDSVIVEIDRVISSSRPSQEVVSYLVWYFISEYQNPKFMGFDKVFVHLVDEYFSKEEIANSTASILNSLQERADKIRPILLGKDAPQLLLIDSLGGLVSFREITNEYTIIFFWDSECGICGKEIIELQKLRELSDYDIEVYSVNVNSDLEKWKVAVNEKNVPGINVNGTRSATKDFHDLYDIYGTPVIYVLNKEKQIIAKRIGANKIIEFIDNYEIQSLSE